MKKWSISICLLICTLGAVAQEAMESTAETGGGRIEYFSADQKGWMIAVFTIIIIVIVLRTFRNKPDV